jgi:pyruvate/2-oxoglutarate dehydrogenase complex dihydrolipoamide dehydrogenase (E3) component
MIVIGEGWIGAEVATCARQRGLEVTVIAPSSVALNRVLGREVGAIYRDIHAEHGVKIPRLAAPGRAERSTSTPPQRTRAEVRNAEARVARPTSTLPADRSPGTRTRPTRPA